MWKIFSYDCQPSVYLLWRKVYLGFLPSFWLGCLLCLFVWYWVVCAVVYFGIKPLLVSSLANIFSQSIDCFFVFSMVYFALQKLINLVSSHLFIFAFISFALGNWPKKILLWFMSKNVLPMSSSRSCMVLCLICKFLSHFEFISVCSLTAF